MKPVDPRLLRYAGAARGFLAASALIGIVQTAVTIVFAWLLTDAITGAIAGRDVSGSLLWLLLTALLRGLLIAASDAAGTRAAAKTGMQLRSALIAAVGVSLVTYRHDDEIQQEFTDTGAMVALPRPHAVGDTP